MRFQSIANTLNISHGHKFTGLFGRRASAKSFKLTSQAMNGFEPYNGHKTVIKICHSHFRQRAKKFAITILVIMFFYNEGQEL